MRSNPDKEESFMHGSLTEGGRLSTVDLLVLTSLNQLILILKQAILMRRSTVMSLPIHSMFPAL